MRIRNRERFLHFFAALVGVSGLAFGQAGVQLQTIPGAKFGKSVSIGGQPSDLVLDEQRQRIYAVSSGANRVYVYNYATGQTAGTIEVGSFPSAAAMSPEGKYLYVTNVSAGSMSVIDLDGDRVVQTVSLPARPEGVAVGFDGRVLITTQGSGTSNALNTLLMFDRTLDNGSQLTPVASPPPISTPSPLPAVFVGRPSTAFPGRLLPTPDGQFIVGMVAINQTTNNAQTTLFVYEAASATVLRNRTVTGQSTVLAVSPDGTRFMAGSTLYDMATLNVIGQVNTGNFPFVVAQGNANQTLNPAINVTNNFGGSAFSPDGKSIYGAFNVQTGVVNSRPLSEALVVMDASNLTARLGLRMPESILGKVLATSDGEQMFATSESGLIDIPIGKMFEYPILVPESNTAFLANDPCNRGIARTSVSVTNIGAGKLTYTVPVLTPALVTEVSSGVAPSTINFVMEPGRAGVVRQPGTNVYTGGALGTSATGIPVTLNSNEAINFPNRIQVFMNFRQDDQRGVVVPVDTSLTNTLGLQELILDEKRQRVYASNAGYNRIEIYDIRRGRLLEPIEVGQLPRSMAMSLDGSTLYVGNSGGESISIVDLDSRRVVGEVSFPPIPRPGNQAVVSPVALGMSLNGLQFIMSNGGLWRVIGNEASPRPASPIINPANPSTTTLPTPAQYSYAAAPGGEYLVALAGNGNVFLYDALADAFTVGRTINQNPIQSYYGPATGAANGSYFAVNGLILSPSLAVVGGAERPGAVQLGAPAAPGQPPTQTVVSQGTRHVAQVYALNDTQLIRVTLPVRQNLTAATRDDSRPTIELVDIRTAAESVVAIAPENPARVALGTQRVPVPARQIVVDKDGTAYMISISGITIVPLAISGQPAKPAISGGSRGVLNANNGTTNFGPGAFVTISGDNLGAVATADQIPLPTVLGGACVTLSDVPLKLLQTSPNQITAQIPDDLRPGQYVVQVRGLALATRSDPAVVTVRAVQ
ncbi:MAG: beta-propeller fold lactonase family protein [Bryobacteraceae bacterium]